MTGDGSLSEVPDMSYLHFQGSNAWFGPLFLSNASSAVEVLLSLPI